MIRTSVGIDGSRVHSLRNLYRDIYACERCIVDPRCAMRLDNDRVVRRVVDRAAMSPLFLVGQALGPDTQRLSGLPYTYRDGTLSRTGRALDQFLRQMGFSIDAGEREFAYPYSSDIVQRYPGRMARGEGDRRPTRQEVANCLEWLLAEFAVVRPRIVLLLGAEPARYFLRACGRPETVEWGAWHDVEVAGNRARAFVVYHPAYQRRKPTLVQRLYDDVAAQVRRLLAVNRSPPS